MPFLKSLASRIINGNLAREHHFILWESVRTQKIGTSGQYFWSCSNSNRSSRILMKSNSKFFLMLYYLQILHCCSQYFCRGVSLHFFCCRLTGRIVQYQLQWCECNDVINWPRHFGHDILESFALPRRRILAHLQYHVSYRKWYVDYADGILKRIIRSLNSNYDGCLDIVHQFLVFVLLLAREI